MPAGVSGSGPGEGVAVFCLFSKTDSDDSSDIFAANVPGRSTDGSIFGGGSFRLAGGGRNHYGILYFISRNIKKGTVIPVLFLLFSKTKSDIICPEEEAFWEQRR